MSSAGFRRAALVLVLFVAFATVAAACGSSSGQGLDKNGVPCEHWCGQGSAAVTIAGQTSTISGGGCYDQGSAGIDVRFGDWQGVEGASDYLELIAFRTGGPTPTPVVTANPSANPYATAYPGDTVSGSVSGTPFVLDTDTVVTLKADGNGTFRGTDLNGAGVVSGTFRCG